MIDIYTDGAWNPISNRGGWAAVLVEDGVKKETLAAAVKNTTNNRMEINAALEGVLHTSTKSELTVHTDSQYLLGCMTKGWQRKANTDLFQQLDEAVSHRKVHWEWVDEKHSNPFHLEAHQTATKLSSQDADSPHIQSQPAEASQPAKLSHIDEAGRPKMVDVSGKAQTEREAVAKGVVRMQPETFNLIKQGGIAKGDVLTVAQLAGIMAAKQTPHLIPLCHPLLINEVRVEFSPDEKTSSIEITATVRCTGTTGVEMEALTAVSIAALTVYDMCKAVDRGMKIENIRLARKSGGKSGTIELE